MRNFLRSGPGILLIIMLVLNFMQGGLRDPGTYFLNMLLSLPAIVIGLSFHEFAHAWTSDKLGDPTPRMQGRVTVNPAAHFDLFGFLALVFCGFGWGNPVIIDNRYYKHPRRDEFLVSIAGVVMNLIVAIVFAFIVKIWLRADPTATLNTETLKGMLLYMVVDVIMVNIVLAVFNILPIPPLDGFGVITNIFNLRKYSWYRPLYNNGYLILMLLLIGGVIDKILSPATSAVYTLIMSNIVF